MAFAHTLHDWYLRSPLAQHVAKPAIAVASWLLFGNLFTVKWHFLVALIARSLFLGTARGAAQLRVEVAGLRPHRMARVLLASAARGARALVVPAAVTLGVLLIGTVVAALVAVAVVYALTHAVSSLLPDGEASPTEYFTALATGVTAALTASQRLGHRRWGWLLVAAVGIGCGAATLSPALDEGHRQQLRATNYVLFLAQPLFSPGVGTVLWEQCSAGCGLLARRLHRRAVPPLPPEEDEVCAICYDPLLDGAPLAHCRWGCGKAVHRACMEEWRQRRNECIFCSTWW